MALLPAAVPESHDGPFDAGPFRWARHPFPLAPLCDRPAGTRALVAVALGWAPLAILAAFEGLALGPNSRRSVLLDCAVYGRYVVAAPVFVMAANVTLPAMARVVRHFIDAELIAESERPRYIQLVASTRRLLLTRWADIVILVLAYVATALRTPPLHEAGASTWMMPGDAAHDTALSLAGWWRTLVSQPLFNALLGAWLWRVLLWTRLVARVAHMDLRLVAAHPDRVGGLRFVFIPLRGFAILAFGVGAVVAGTVAEKVLVDGQSLASFRYLVGAQVLGVLAIFAGPLLVLTGPLVRLKASGTLQYGRLASLMDHVFQQRWLGGASLTSAALEAPDFSATTDLYAIVANVSAMNPFVLDVNALALLAGATLLPYVPLVLAVMPLSDILKLAAGALG